MIDQNTVTCKYPGNNPKSSVFPGSPRRYPRLSEGSRDETSAFSHSVWPLHSQAPLPSSVEGGPLKENIYCDQMDNASVTKCDKPSNEHQSTNEVATTVTSDFSPSSAQITSPRILLCEFCDAVFASSSGLRRHTNSVHLNKYPYACEVCGKGFLLKQRYMNHRKWHDSKTYSM